MEQLFNEITHLTGLSAGVQVRIIKSLVIIVIMLLIQMLLRAILWRRVTDVRLRYRWQKTFTYLTTLTAFALVGIVCFQGAKAVATYLGLVSAGLAIALQDIVANFAGWIFIMWRRPFSTGDRIQVGDHKGDVIDIRMFQFSLLEIGNWVDADQSTGRVIHVPNRDVLSKVTANFATGFQFIWDEIPVLVTFESDWRKAKQILKEVVTKHAEHLSKSAEKRVKEASKRYMIFYSVLTPTVFTDVRDCGVLLTLRFLCEPRRRRSARQEIWEDILEQFAACSDIDFAYPTQRFYDHRTEGKGAPSHTN